MLDTDKEFTWQCHDGTGLYYYNARYYDPTIGRFISPDPLIPGAGNPQAWNRYVYCLNNPLAYVDPLGYWGLNDPNVVTHNKRPCSSQGFLKPRCFAILL